MIALIISTVCGALYSIFFKIFQMKRIDRRQAIIFNYVTAVTLGCILSYEGGMSINPLKTQWFIPALFLGMFFYSGMIILSGSTLKAGVAISTVASRASMIAPILICYSFIPGSARPKWLAIIIALAALIMIIFDGKKQIAEVSGKWKYLLPILVFINFGIATSGVKLLQYHISSSYSGTGSDVVNQELSMLSATIFLAAMVTGLVHLAISSRKEPFHFSLMNVLGGVALGASNFFCTFLLMIAMKSIDTSFLYPFHNMGIVLIGTFVGWLAFHEKLRAHQTLGIIIAIITIWWLSV